MTPVMLTLACSGCEATTTCGPLSRRFESAFGGNEPHGWVMFDPYTDCTYCPECWASIEFDAGRGGEDD